MPLGPLIGVGTAGAVLVVMGWVIYRQRLRRYTSEHPTGLDDELIRRIEEEGRIDVDEPTDADEVRAEEERFWSETWDQPEEL